jgi:hypothetical protein
LALVNRAQVLQEYAHAATHGVRCDREEFCAIRNPQLTKLDDILDAANNLSADEQEDLIRILTHRLKERRRAPHTRSVEFAKNESLGKSKTTTLDFDDIWDRIDEDE